VVIGLMPFAVILLLAVWLVVFLATRYVSVASMGAALALPVLTHIGARFHKNADGVSLWEAGAWNKPLFAFAVIIAILAVWKHRSNIQRLLSGTESRFERKKA
jgi:acyl phosphate:glycerol-3-phosphate acyltransferase